MRLRPSPVPGLRRCGGGPGVEGGDPGSAASWRIVDSTIPSEPSDEVWLRAPIKGVACGVRVEDIEDPLMKEIRPAHPRSRACTPATPGEAGVLRAIEKRMVRRFARKTLRRLLPGADEGLSYGVPCLEVDGKGVAGLAALRSHCTYFPMSGSVVGALRKELAAHRALSARQGEGPRARLLR